MQWIPISKRPTHGEHVLIWGTNDSGGYFCTDAKYWRGEWLMFHQDDNAWTVPCEYPTHWMPLPQPPQTKPQGE